MVNPKMIRKKIASLSTHKSKAADSSNEYTARAKPVHVNAARRATEMHWWRFGVILQTLLVSDFGTTATLESV
jgi:hypothetical protein